MTGKKADGYGGYSLDYLENLLKRVDTEIAKANVYAKTNYDSAHKDFERYRSELYEYERALSRDWRTPAKRPTPPRLIKPIGAVQPKRPKRPMPPARPIPISNEGSMIYRTLADKIIKNAKPKAAEATNDKGKKEDMSYTSREENEDLGAGEGSVAGAVYVRDTVNLHVASAAAKWTHASNAKYAVLAAISFVALALISTGSIIAIVMGVALLVAGFFPHMAKRNLLKNNKMIVLESFEGYGAKWQQELHRGFNQLQRLTEEAQDPNAPAEIKAAFAEIEPVLWAQALKVSALLNKLRGGSMGDIDADTKMILRNKFLEFKQQVDKIDEVFKIVHSFSVLDLDLSTEVISADEITGYLRNALDTRKALASQSVTDHDDVSTILADSVKELSSTSDDMDGILDSVRASLDASKAKQAQPVQALRKATA